MVSKKKMLIEEIEKLKLENERLKADVHLRDEWNKLLWALSNRCICGLWEQMSFAWIAEAIWMPHL